ncbi:MAG: hypothetical protein JWO50_599 [Candidatus Kaiserbacteria bacterium]|nr:hypothetical protein [Candidatus Kaiserbacteria bacterium]
MSFYLGMGFVMIVIVVAILVWLSLLHSREQKQELKILALLSDLGRLNGLEMFEYDNSISPSNLYKRLLRLEQDGVICGENFVHLPGTALPVKRKFWITMKGNSRLKYLELNFK